MHVKTASFLNHSLLLFSKTRSISEPDAHRLSYADELSGTYSRVLVLQRVFYVGSKDVISGPHICEVGASLTALPSAPWSYFSFPFFRLTPNFTNSKTPTNQEDLWASLGYRS